jgi:hypothetical protein
LELFCSRFSGKARVCATALMRATTAADFSLSHEDAVLEEKIDPPLITYVAGSAASTAH